MLNIAKKRDLNYSTRAALHKLKVTEDGAGQYFEGEPSRYFWCKDLGFSTVYNSVDGHVEKISKGSLETIDLSDGEVVPEDRIYYAGDMYIVVSVAFDNVNPIQRISNRQNGKTVIEVRK